jgi:predicted AAA+ superfamily ATPase
MAVDVYKVAGGMGIMPVPAALMSMIYIEEGDMVGQMMRLLEQYPIHPELIQRIKIITIRIPQQVAVVILSATVDFKFSLWS